MHATLPFQEAFCSSTAEYIESEAKDGHVMVLYRLLMWRRYPIPTRKHPWIVLAYFSRQSALTFRPCCFE